MHTMLKSLFAATLLVAGAAIAADAPDAVVGTWKLNVAKSTFSPGPALKSQTRQYLQTADGLKLTMTSVAADGKTMVSTMIFKYDGKPHTMAGNPDFDSVSVTRNDAGVTHSTQWKAGKDVGTGVRTVAKDGKTMTFAQKGTHVGGAKYDDMLYYDRQ
jgi:hypothetical protein